MKITRVIAGMIAASALATSAVVAVPAANAQHRTAAKAAVGTTALATVLAPYKDSFNNNWHDYNIVTHAVFAVLDAKPDSAVKVLASGDTALTAFIPNDKAFQTLVRQLTGKTIKTEEGVFTAVASLGIPTVEQVLLYHVVPGATITSAMALKSNGAVLKTALGKSIRVAVYHRGEISLWDANKLVRNPRVILSQVDINKGSAQIAHGIDRVLLPITFVPKH